MAYDFWRRWQKEYLLELRSFHEISQLKGGQWGLGPETPSSRRIAAPNTFGRRPGWRSWRWGETGPKERLYSVGQTEPFYSALFSWSSPWRLTSVGRMWWNYEYIFDQGSSHLRICILFFSVNSKSRWCSVCCHCLVHCPPAHSIWLFLHFSTSGSFTSLHLFSTCYYIRTSSLSNRRHNDNVTDYDGRHFKCNDQTYWRRGISEVGIKILTLPFLVHLV